jgi:hypothetical protein
MLRQKVCGDLFLQSSIQRAHAVQWTQAGAAGRPCSVGQGHKLRRDQNGFGVSQGGADKEKCLRGKLPLAVREYSHAQSSPFLKLWLTYPILRVGRQPAGCRSRASLRLLGQKRRRREALRSYLSSVSPGLKPLEDGLPSGFSRFSLLQF